MADLTIYQISTSILTNIANAIRSKLGTTTTYAPTDMAAAIESIPSLDDVTSRSSSDLTVSGATVTAPAGYYASAASKSVASGSVAIDFQITTDVQIDSATGRITSFGSETNTVVIPSVTTAGYISDTNAINVGTSLQEQGTLQLTTKGATTITPSTSSQQAVASGVYTTGAITVAAIPSNYIDVADTTTYSYGTGDPTSSTQGDIYLKVVS